MNDYKISKKNLEEIHFDDKKLLQTEISNHLNENNHLKNSLQHLRDELESQAYSKQKSVQAAHVEKNLNIEQLKNSIISLRAELEELQAKMQVSVQKAISESSTEILLLKKTIISLRGELEALSIKKNEEVQQAISNRESEITQLKLVSRVMKTKLILLFY